MIASSNNEQNKWYERISAKYTASSPMRLCLFILLLIAFFMDIYVLNRHTTLVADDYGFQLLSNSINSPHDYFAILYQKYFNWTGRMISESFTYLFFSLDKKIFNIINSLGYIVLVLLIYFNIVGKKKIFLSLLIFINFFFFVFLPAFGQDILWITGSANYLWPTLIALSYTLLWRCYSPERIKLYSNPLFLLFCIVLGFCAGVTNENTSIAIFFMSVIFIIYYKKCYNKICTFSIVVAVSELLGSIFLLMAPGNFVRARITGEVSHLGNFYRNLGNLLDPTCLLIPLLIFCILYILLKDADKKIACIFALTSIVAVLSLSASPANFKGRIVLSGLAFMMIAAGILYTKIDFTNRKIKQIVCLLAVTFAIGSLKLYTSAIADIEDYESEYNINLQIIEQEKAAGHRDIVVNNISSISRFCASYGLVEIKPMPNDGQNSAVAEYFKIDTIRASYIFPSVSD